MASLRCRGKLVSELLCKLLVENKMGNFAGQGLLDKADIATCMRQFLDR